MAVKSRKCRNCKQYEKVEVGRIINGAFFCCEDCVAEYAINSARKLRARRERQDRRKAKERLKSRSDHLREAQAAFNAFIRERDKGLKCISCGRHHEGQWHAGHYLSVGAHPEMRFDESNVHKQCAPCNNHLSGNIINYRKGLIARYGEFIVDYLEGPHNVKKYTVEEIKQIKKEYKEKLNKLKSK